LTAALIESMAILRTGGGQEHGRGLDLIVLQHTHCGIKGCYHHAPELLAPYMGVPLAELDGLVITDPHRGVGIGIARLRKSSEVPGGFRVTGLGYDVATSRIETVAPATLLRDDEA
jgi:carbonic anhydrase